jgi:hypothetical protein
VLYYHFSFFGSIWQLCFPRCSNPLVLVMAYVFVDTELHQNLDDVRPPVRVLPKLSETMVGEPPDASDWTSADVAKFFCDMGFTEEAKAFESQVNVVNYADNCEIELGC